ncbi:MAG: GNAT family N-acetyltransferase [Gammaproteobacteria bacterium]|nr:GNAT family N-acetyltransferase [Gammaproteobacteria bacterium]
MDTPRHSADDVQCVSALSSFSAHEWNALSGSQPFLQHGFLDAQEHSQSVAPESGWEPHHLALRDKGKLIGALPLYRKYHSYGEFVFDWGWADACQRAGIAYYPKLLSAVPFTPVTGPRLLGHQADALIEAGKREAERGQHVSWHVLFPARDELALWRAHDFMVREDCQFQWFDRDYGDFDGFLGALKSRRRKEIRRERRQVHEAGVTLRTLAGEDLDPDTLSQVYGCYTAAYAIRGQQPYLRPGFFRAIVKTQPDSIVVFAAFRDGHMVAAAICFRDDECLYGRHWGSLVDIPGLHFEACYYQGIAYCLDQGLGRFEPGTQGEHKISRGFEPVPVYSAHYIRHPGLRDAIADFLQRETPVIADYRERAAELLPYKERQA